MDRKTRGFLALAFLSMLAAPSFAQPEVIPQFQKQYRLFSAFFHGYNLRLADAPVPRPGPFEVLVKVRAVSINRRDLYVASGYYPMKKRKSFVPLSDGAGEVVAIGGSVTRFKIGDRVAAIYFQNWLSGEGTPQMAESALGAEIDGMLTQYVKLNEQGLVTLPKNLSYEEGATLPCAGVTAWTALFSRGRMKSTDNVLIEGTGGVSMFGLQFAAAIRAKTIITSSSDKKLERAKLLGAIATINYRENEDWEQRVRELTDGLGVQQVLDVGGEDTLPRAIKALAPGGHIALVGGLSGFDARIRALDLMPIRAQISGISVGSRADFEAMNTFIERYDLHPVIDKAFDFKDAQQAYDYMDSGNHFGKIVIRVM
jgi:NADPH:quinone reductase-like Zn-dependent oxidoreductase